MKLRKSNPPQPDRFSKLIGDIAETLIKQIGEGTAPWQKTWEPGQRTTEHNLRTKKDYWGVNQLWLSAVSQKHGFPDTRWATFRQIKEEGGRVRKGEKGTQVTGWFEVGRDERLKQEREALEAGQEIKLPKQFRSTAYTIFNISQTDGIPPVRVEKPNWEPYKIAEQIAKNSGVEIRHGGNRALYHIGQDYIQMPEMGQFQSQQDYYMTLMHELGHATGHPNRMNRDCLVAGTKPGPSQETLRAMEELRAEISAMMTCTRIGLGHRPQNGVSYIDAWSKLLKDRPHEIRAAATEAQKMSTFLLEGMGKNIHIDLDWRPEREEQERKTKEALNVLMPNQRVGADISPDEAMQKRLAHPRPGDEFYPNPFLNVTGKPPALPLGQVAKRPAKPPVFSMER